MNSNIEPSPRPKVRLVRYFGVAALVVIIVCVAIIAWMAYVGISVSLQAENNLHATCFTIRLVEQFVRENGRWPSSWRELEDTSLANDPPYDWPDASNVIQQRVEIDFHADLTEISVQPPMNFWAIHPIGPYYEYRDYGYVESLQKAIKEAIAADGAP